MLSKLFKKLTELGPAFFIIGYVIGTGSVTSMVISGAKYGLNFWWPLLLSCFFTYFLLIAISKLTIVTGETLMFSFKRHFGKFFTLFIVSALVVSIVSSVIGVMGVVADVFQEWLYQISAGAIEINKTLIALVFIILLLILFWTGKHQNFISWMTIMVSLMALCFVITSFMVLTEPGVNVKEFFPDKILGENSGLIVAGMVGTTMAGVCLVSRSILVQEQGWQVADIPAENKDARYSMILTFIISLAIMIASAGTLYLQGIEIDNPIDMMSALEPLAGEFALTVFAMGILAAGLSSIFPNLLLFPWLLSDYNNTPRDMKRSLYKAIVILVGLSTLIVPFFGGRPIWILIASQALSPFIMPLLTLFLIILLNKKDVMKEHTVGWPMNIALGATLLFNCYMLFVAIEGFINFAMTDGAV